MQMKNAGKLNIKLFAMIILMMVAVSLTIVGAAYAAYTHSQNVQRTVASYDEAGELFSSNYLISGTGSDNIRTVTVSSPTISAVAGISICNYAQHNPGRFSDTDIEYSISATLMKRQGETFVTASSSDVGIYKVTLTKGQSSITLTQNNLTASLPNSTLDGRRAHSDTYTLSFNSDSDNQFTSDLYVLVVAESVSGLIPPITLNGYFHAEVVNEREDIGWTGTISDNKENGRTPNDYAAFNYVIMGVGAGRYRLSWKNEYISLALNSLYDLTGQYTETYVDQGQTVRVVFEDAQAGEKYIIFEVDSTSVNRYDLVFVKNAGFPNAATWNDVAHYITLEPYASA
ncbi:MAG: hypothetical protein J6X29_02930 [Clostridia bacterium]|nr:hypothetical protein [Clostridia bacterium]